MRVNGKNMPFGDSIDEWVVASSNNSWLLYLLPQYYKEEEEVDRKSLWECDANGFRVFEIKIDNTPTSLVKKCGVRLVYKRDIEYLDCTM